MVDILSGRAARSAALTPDVAAGPAILTSLSKIFSGRRAMID
jgi:hypothetical protein